MIILEPLQVRMSGHQLATSTYDMMMMTMVMTMVMVTMVMTMRPKNMNKTVTYPPHEP